MGTSVEFIIGQSVVQQCVCSKGGPDMSAINSPGRPVLPQTVWGDRATCSATDSLGGPVEVRQANHH